MLTSKQIRRKYIEFYKKHGHAEIPSASLIPENDPSTLFITAGMQPIVPFLLGEKHPAGQRLVNSQKCIRTGDIDEVGDKTHHTFFEMLGHWSLGDYFKNEAIKMSWEFLTQDLGLDIKRLAFSVFGGNESSPQDNDAVEIWKSLGVSDERIARLKDNWWEQKSATSGPCGPDTEMFYWSDESTPAPDKFDPEDDRWVEIGNDVLMQYEKKGQGKYEPAKQKNIDNGTGLERLTAVLNGLSDNYQTDLFLPIIEKIEELSGKQYSRDAVYRVSENETDGDNKDTINGVSTDTINKSMRIIADHLRAATFIMADEKGVEPSNVDQGYVVRKLIRRAIRHGRQLGIQENFTHTIGQVVISIMQDVYPELEKNKKFVLDNLSAEEEKFTKTLQQGLKELEKIFDEFVSKQGKSPMVANKVVSGEKVKISNPLITGKEAFKLFSTRGLPIEIIKEFAKNKGFFIDEDEFEKEMKQHQELSRTASAGKFKGGLANQSEQTVKYHTAAHLMLAALRQVLGEHVAQKGSNITEERMRFDFSHAEKMTDEQKSEVERLVNSWIEQDLPVACQEMSLDQAKQIGAMGVFESKYGEKVKVYTVGDKDNPTSCEICGGPHVERTGVLGKFRIKKEQSSSAGVRRIKAILE